MAQGKRSSPEAQQEVLRYIKQKKSVKWISAKTGMSQSTIKGIRKEDPSSMRMTTIPKQVDRARYPSIKRVKSRATYESITEKHSIKPWIWKFPNKPYLEYLEKLGSLAGRWKYNLLSRHRMRKGVKCSPWITAIQLLIGRSGFSVMRNSI
jgi:response regulator of citrate/malate metabolism